MAIDFYELCTSCGSLKSLDTLHFGMCSLKHVIYIPGGAGFLNHQQYEPLLVTTDHESQLGGGY